VGEGVAVGRARVIASPSEFARFEKGEILVTEPVADYLGGRLELDDRGLQTLRGVTQPRHLLAVVWQEPSDATP